MSPAQRLRALAKRTALDGIAEELVAIAAELDQRPAAQAEREAHEPNAKLMELAKRTALDSIGEELVASKALSWLAACRTLERLGYTYHGAELWKPPLGNSAAQPGAQHDPIPMVLHCPNCGRQHIDAPEEHWNREFLYSWENPPHLSHLCHGCNTIWRPADVPTTGVHAVSTKGKADTWQPGQAATFVPAQTKAGES